MSLGFPFGFGAMPIPNADPDDPRRLLRQAPFDPAQAPPLLNALDPSGPAGAVVHQPGARMSGIGLASPAIAMDEADTQRLERQAGMVPGAEGGAPQGLATMGTADIARLFGREPMGAPQGFSGTSGMIVPPEQGASARGVPLPPMRPGDEELAVPRPSTAPRPPFGFGSPTRAPVPASPQADLPAPGAVPAVGQAADGGIPTPAGSPAAPTSPAGAATAPKAAAEPGFGDKLGAGLDRFFGNGGGDLLQSIGVGLLSTPGFGAGLAAGLKNYQSVSEKKSVTDLAKAEFGLKLQKAAQEATGLKGNRAFIKAAFPNLTSEQVEGGASNSALVSAAIARIQNPNAGRDMKADSSGVQRWTDTGEPVFKGDEGKTEWVQAKTPNGGTIVYDKGDPTKSQVLIPGEQVRQATQEELAAWGLKPMPGQTVKMTSKGPEMIGSPQRPEVKTFELRDGSKVERQWDPATNTWAEPSYGANPPTAQGPTNPFATGKFNEGQGKAAGFADRMLGSEQILRGLETVNQGAITGTIGGLLPNPLKSEDRQKLEQSQRDFVNAQLRRESGAAISPSEFSNAEKQYFPQPGDTDAVIAQKRTNRQRAIEAMGREGGPAYAPSKKFDETGAIVPSMTPADRFKQLRGAGLSKADAYARMHTEGY